MRILARDPERELPAAGVVAGDGGARLHRRWEQPLVDDAQVHRDGRRRERGIRIAAGDRPGERDVRADVGMQLRRTGHRRLLGIDDGAERIVVDVDQIERVARRLARLGDDERDAVADVAHRVDGEQRMRRHLEVAVRHHPGARHRIHLVRPGRGRCRRRRRRDWCGPARCRSALTRACAHGLRSTAAYSMRGSWMSSVYVALPVMRRGSSRRLRPCRSE